MESMPGKVGGGGGGEGRQAGCRLQLRVHVFLKNHMQGLIESIALRYVNLFIIYPHETLAHKKASIKKSCFDCNIP